MTALRPVLIICQNECEKTNLAQEKEICLAKSKMRNGSNTPIVNAFAFKTRYQAHIFHNPHARTTSHVPLVAL